MPRTYDYSIMPTIPPRVRRHVELAEEILAVASQLAKHSSRAFRIEPRRIKRGTTLRPGKDTPLWNELRRLLRPYLYQHGQQVGLGRMVGLPRQRINAFITRGTQMPDAERTLQILIWLSAVRRNKPPS
jgi:hypothetical protein